MKNRWLLFLALGVIAAIIFTFFIIYLLPVRKAGQNQALPSQNLIEPTVTFINPSLGPNSAPVRLVVFSDFFCAACRQMADSLTVARNTFQDQIQIVWKNLPNDSINSLSSLAASAAMCAHRQGEFWPYHDLLFSRQTYLSPDQFPLLAAQAGLDVELFRSCYESRETLPIVERDLQEANGLRLTAAPTLFINGQRFTGALDTQTLVQYVNQILEK